MANRTAMCRECCCVIGSTAIEGHINWHVQLTKAILSASGMLSPEAIEAQLISTRNYFHGKITVAW